MNQKLCSFSKLANGLDLFTAFWCCSFSSRANYNHAAIKGLVICRITGQVTRAFDCCVIVFCNRAETMHGEDLATHSGKLWFFDICTVLVVQCFLEQQDKAEGDKDLHTDFAGNYNLSDDLGIPSVNNSEPLIMNELPDDEYRHIVQTLNKEQKEFFYHVLHLITTSEEPFYCFLSGGAGVSKSHVTKALYQAALKYYNTRPGINFNETKVLMLAHTGKAAYNIQGNTIHSALAIPACQSLKNYKSLDSSRLNTLRSQIGRLKLIFIDEISMVGNNMFTVQIYNRLKISKAVHCHLVVSV